MKKQTKKSKIISLLFNGIQPAQIAKQVKCSIQTVYSVRHEQKKKTAKPSLKQAILDTIIAKQNKGVAGVKFAAAEVKKEGEPIKHDSSDNSPYPYMTQSLATANEVQVDGTHYMKKAIQPWDAITDWKLGFLDGNVVKCMARWKDKGGLVDLRKAKHYLDKLIEVEES